MPACVYRYVSGCVRVCVCACMHACVRACMRVWLHVATYKRKDTNCSRSVKAVHVVSGRLLSRHEISSCFPSQVRTVLGLKSRLVKRQEAVIAEESLFGKSTIQKTINTKNYWK